MKFILTTDIHGSILSHQYLDNSIISHSLSRFSTALKQYQNEEIITIDNGDVLQGTPLTTFNNRYQDFSVMAKAFNHLNLNYYNLGNHDFNYGQEVLSRYLNQQNATCLTSNILMDHQPIGQSQIFINRDNIKFGLIGVVTDYIINWEKPQNIENIQILDVIETLTQEVNELKNIVDHIIVIYHGGFERDLVTGEPTETLTGENVGYELTKIEGIDVIVSGHQHRSFVANVNGVLCTQCSHNAQEYVELNYDNHTFSAQIIDTSRFDIDEAYEALFQKEEDQTQTWLDTQIGIGPDMSIKDVFKAQVHKPLFVSFMNQVQRAHFSADFSASSLFNVSPGLKPTISMRDLVASYPFPNTLSLLEIDKATLLDYLELNATYFILENNEISINPKFTTPKLQMYNYDMVDGLSYTIDVSQPEGQRIKNLVLPEDKETYTIVFNNYRASGGGDFQMIKNCHKIKEEPTEVIDLLYDYIKSNSPLEIEHTDNIQIIR